METHVRFTILHSFIYTKITFDAGAMAKLRIHLALRVLPRVFDKHGTLARPKNTNHSITAPRVCLP
jgi:hypothetical protein